MSDLPTPKLTLNPSLNTNSKELIEKDEYKEVKLSDEEVKIVDEFAEKIDIYNSNIIITYGAEAQKKMTDFSESALNLVKTKDLSAVGNILTDVVLELKGFDTTEKTKGVLSFFKKPVNKVESIKIKYNKAEANIEKVCQILEQHQLEILKDISMLDKMFELNKEYFKELTMYILAGKQKLEDLRNNKLAQLQEKAKLSGRPEDAQDANDLASLCERFEKKIHDLELTRTISLQMGPQIRLVQNNNILMSEKIQSTLVNTIPLWKSQMVIAIGIAHSTDAAKAQQAVSNATNEMLKRNAEQLKMATIETAKESERAIVDIETLKHTNEQLISTFDEVLNIQKDGREKRRQAEEELVKIENELKRKLMEINR